MKSSAKNFLLCFPQHNMASKLPLCFLCLCNCTFIQKICQHHTCSSRVRLATFKSVMLGTLTACFSILRKYASHSSSRCFLNVCIVSFSSLLHSLLTCVINNMVIIMYRRSGNFRVKNNSRENFSTLINFRGFVRSAKYF